MKKDVSSMRSRVKCIHSINQCNIILKYLIVSMIRFEGELRLTNSVVKVTLPKFIIPFYL